MNHLKMEDSFFYWPMSWVTLGLWEGRALHRRPSHLLKNPIIINLPFRGRTSTKEVDEQMLNVQNKNTTYWDILFSIIYWMQKIVMSYLFLSQVCIFFEEDSHKSIILKLLSMTLLSISICLYDWIIKLKV